MGEIRIVGPGKNTRISFSGMQESSVHDDTGIKACTDGFCLVLQKNPHFTLNSETSQRTQLDILTV